MPSLGGVRLPPRFLIPAFVLIALLLYFRASITATLPPLATRKNTGRQSQGSIEIEGPANATLGFGGLFVVSGPGSNRREHLEQAAAITELQLTIPKQPAWTDEDIDGFKADGQDAVASKGSVMAWLSHHVVLRAFLDSGLESALIFEDDVDWDIRLRTQQIPMVQKAVRAVASSDSDEALYPYGTAADWELLYLGHCGDYFKDVPSGVGVGHAYPSTLTSIPHIIFEDPTMLWRAYLHPFTASLLTAFGLPEKHRVVHKSAWPLCSFGYAVTRQSAQKILTSIAPPKEIPSRKLIAYDTALLAGCRDGPLKCFSVTPELFHHMQGKSMIEGEDEKEHKVGIPPVDAAGMDQTEWRGETSNIACGFWSGDFWYEGGDVAAFERLRDQVGREGKCLKGDGRRG